MIQSVALPSRRPLFTLVELLTVIVILALVASALLPVLRSAQRRGKQSACSANLRQLYMAFVTYSLDYGRETPPMQYSAIGEILPTRQDCSNNRLILKKIGLDARHYACPAADRSVPVPGNAWHAPLQYLATEERLLTDYIYFGGPIVSEPGLNENARINSASDPDKFVMDKDSVLGRFSAERVFMADRVGISPDRYISHINHRKAPDRPDGGNVAYGDGHVRWRVDFPTVLLPTLAPANGLWDFTRNGDLVTTADKRNNIRYWVDGM